ncbi:hypothetical protein Bhyg_12201 [Pseudolycoriella hygida]|uniref:Uncharacterized protein n=1 Tax=Pseudolycoriella hygida TaxID=35572 RepID=A0A9Q0MWT1_9DIPT|nr:hypothetical protein Bhyg_12201 [Pseudolycoriella hygida]
MFVVVGNSSVSKDAIKYHFKDVKTVDDLEIPVQRLNKSELVATFPYLRDVPFEDYENGLAGILIGLNNPKIGIPLEIVESTESGPIATRARIGWTVHGPTYKSETMSEDEVEPLSLNYHSVEECSCEHEHDNDLHHSLPSGLKNLIKELRNVETIPISLDASQLANYMINDKFFFKGKELETFLRISRRPNPKKGLSSYDLKFIDGESNPLIFLDRFEKCVDVKTDKDKLYKIRNFVIEEHKPEFSKYFFKGEWEAAREAFLKKYSYAFTENKRKALDFKLQADTSLRSFVHRKIIALTTYTTLKLENQLEVILAELPSQISSLFTRNLKLNATKTEILVFCDTVQDNVDELENSEASGNTTLTLQQSQTDDAQDLELFHSSDDQTEICSSETERSNSSVSNRSRKRRKGHESANRARPSKIVRVIAEGTESSQSSTTSLSKV